MVIVVATKTSYDYTSYSAPFEEYATQTKNKLHESGFMVEKDLSPGDAKKKKIRIMLN